MNIVDIIIKKRDKKELSEQEIKYFIENYCNNNIKDYQAKDGEEKSKEGGSEGYLVDNAENYKYNKGHTEVDERRNVL